MQTAGKGSAACVCDSDFADVESIEGGEREGGDQAGGEVGERKKEDREIILHPGKMEGNDKERFKKEG